MWGQSRVSFEKCWEVPRKFVSSPISAVVLGCSIRALVVPAGAGERWNRLMLIHSSFIASVSNVPVLPSVLIGEHYVLCTSLGKILTYQVNPKKGTYLRKRGALVKKLIHTMSLLRRNNFPSRGCWGKNAKSFLMREINGEGDIYLSGFRFDFVLATCIPKCAAEVR